MLFNNKAFSPSWDLMSPKMWDIVEKIKSKAFCSVFTKRKVIIIVSRLFFSPVEIALILLECRIFSHTVLRNGQYNAVTAAIKCWKNYSCLKCRFWGDSLLNSSSFWFCSFTLHSFPDLPGMYVVKKLQFSLIWPLNMLVITPVQVSLSKLHTLFGLWWWERKSVFCPTS